MAIFRDSQSNFMVRKSMLPKYVGRSKILVLSLGQESRKINGYSTGKSAQYSAINYMGKESEKEWI